MADGEEWKEERRNREEGIGKRAGLRAAGGFVIGGGSRRVLARRMRMGTSVLIRQGSQSAPEKASGLIHTDSGLCVGRPLALVVARPSPEGKSGVGPLRHLYEQ